MTLMLPALVVPFRWRHLLVYGPEAAALGLAEPLFGPPVYVRPGYWLLGENDYLLPEAFIDDVGQRWEGQEALAMIEQRGDLFPRADVIGRLRSGEARSVFVKELDLAVMAAFASAEPGGANPVRLDVGLEARAVPDGFALTPAPPPPELELAARALPCYRLAPGVFGAVGAAIVSQLLASNRPDWRLTFDEVDDMVGE